MSTSDRRAALQVARSLQSQLFFYEVEWGGRVLQDGVEDVYMFLDDEQETSEREELPTGVITLLTKCYTPGCGDDGPCYAYACPRKGGGSAMILSTPLQGGGDEASMMQKQPVWKDVVRGVANGVIGSVAMRSPIFFLPQAQNWDGDKKRCSKEAESDGDALRLER